jgi:hypothetical protein
MAEMEAGKEMSDAYMVGWRAGYHNAMLAERKRIIEIIESVTNKDVADKLIKEIKKVNA